MKRTTEAEIAPVIQHVLITAQVPATVVILIREEGIEVVAGGVCEFPPELVVKCLRAAADIAEARQAALQQQVPGGQAN